MSYLSLINLYNYFRQGIKIIRGRAGIYNPYGRLIMTKLLDDKSDIAEIVRSVILLLKFPGVLFIDCQGFLQDPFEDVVFYYASQNSSLPLQNGENHIFLETKEDRAETIKYFSNLTNSEIHTIWFDTHNKLGGLSASGFKPLRLVSLNFFYEPSQYHINEGFQK